MESKPVSQNEGRPCPICKAPLRVTEVYPGTLPLEGGGLFATSSYECLGETPHKWGEQTDRLPAPGAQVGIMLVPLD